MYLFGFDSIPWLQEKTLSALEQSVRLVDLAHEPDTTPWYRRALIEIAEPLITTLMPVVAFVHVAQEAAEHDDIRMVVEGGAFALSRWGKKWDISAPRRVGRMSLTELRLVDENEEKSAEVEHPASNI